MTTYPLTDEDREIQDRTRRFVDEDLIPWEQHAEEHGGADPGGYPRDPPTEGARARPRRDEPAHRPRRRWLHDAPAGPGPRADRPRHERPWLGAPHTGRLGARGDDRGADRALAEARHPRGGPRVLRDHRGRRRQRRRRDRGDRPPRRRRLRAERREDARDLVQHRRPHLLPGQARRRRERGRPRDVRRGQGHARYPSDRGAAVHAHVPRHPCADRVRGRPRPRGPADRRRGRRDGVHLRVVPLRAPDDRGPLLRRGRPPDRGGHLVRDRAGAVRPADHREPGASASCWRTPSRSSGRPG